MGKPIAPKGVKMNQEIKRQWIDALTSGKYKQGYHQLKTFDGFCCLGVLCELAVEAGIINKLDEGYISEHGYSYQFLPREVMAWAELDDETVRLDNREIFKRESLIDMNDNKFSFQEIAATIQEKL